MILQHRSPSDFLNCERCGLHKYRRKVVLGRGAIPAPILFIGDAPGKIDDIHGQACAGPAGKVLDSLIVDAIALAGIQDPPAHYITTAIGCRPCAKLGGDNREPAEDEILACLPRLEVLVHQIKPVVVVFLGNLAFKYFGKRFAEHFRIYHPIYLMKGGGKAHPEYGLTVRKLSEAYTYYQKEFSNGWTTDYAAEGLFNDY